MIYGYNQSYAQNYRCLLIRFLRVKGSQGSYLVYVVENACENDIVAPDRIDFLNAFVGVYIDISNTIFNSYLNHSLSSIN